MENLKQFRPDPNLRLMDQVRQVLRYHHYAYRTEQTYCDWILRYIRFHGFKIHPRNMGKNEIETFLSHLSVQQNGAASTQRQALNAIVFLYKKVLDMPVDENLEPVRAKRQPRPPVVMSQAEVIRVLGNMQGLHLLMAKLLYDSGLRLMECIRLRVQDLDFERKLIYVRAAKSPEWQYLFPSKKRSKDPRTGTTRRHHVQESGLQKAVKTTRGFSSLWGVIPSDTVLPPTCLKTASTSGWSRS